MAGQLAAVRWQQARPRAARLAAGVCAHAEVLSSMVREETRHNWAKVLDMMVAKI
jgi:hypothetical protein